MTQPSVQREFWRYTLPSIGALMVNGLNELVDAAFVGSHVGYQGLAAITLSWPIICAVIGVGLMIGAAGGSLMSIHRGAGEHDQAQRILNRSVGLCLLLGPVCALIVMLADGPLLQLQGSAGETARLAQLYSGVFAAGCVINLVAIALPMMVRNDGSPMVSTLIMASSALVNLIGDWLLVSWLDQGVAGAALASIVAKAAALAGGLLYFCRYSPQLRLRRAEMLPDLAFAKRVVGLGASTFIMYIYAGVDISIHNALLMRLGTPLDVAALAIAGYLMMLFYFLSEGVANGMQPLVSFHHGRGNPQRVHTTITLAIQVILVAGLSWTALVYLAPEWLISLFSNDNPQLTEVARNGMYLHLYAMTIDGLLVLSAVYFQALDQGRRSLFVSVGNIAIQIPFFLILPWWLGIDGVWLVLPTSTTVLFLILLPMFWKQWQQDRCALRV
ncbi:MATE family efflux transporter [Oceanobacter mangrovi]|uniref:MATE family efflux transporter n=1 Tax=Oceanobacter mangrovi TaxID=2862510 RepID=UPI001C8E0ADB|nr:MATE family efflux transporter [Oceanobacter mangrovi]